MVDWAVHRCRGFDARGADGESRLFVPCLAATTGDWPEQCELTSTSMKGCSIWFLVRKEDMAKADAELAPLEARTEDGIMGVRGGRGRLRLLGLVAPWRRGRRGSHGRHPEARLGAGPLQSLTPSQRAPLQSLTPSPPPVPMPQAIAAANAAMNKAAKARALQAYGVTSTKEVSPALAPATAFSTGYMSD